MGQTILLIRTLCDKWETGQFHNKAEAINELYEGMVKLVTPYKDSSSAVLTLVVSGMVHGADQFEESELPQHPNFVSIWNAGKFRGPRA